MSARLISVLLVMIVGVAPGWTQSRKQTAPEKFSSPIQTRTDTAAAGARLTVQIDRYTPDNARKEMTDALTQNGYTGFVNTLRKAPAVGTVVIGDQKFTLRWAREQSTAKGRAISLVTDTPVFFVGGGRVDAKPREGFQLGVIQIDVDDYGFGTGTMAAAARVKPDGKGGVVIEDYAEEPIKLTFVTRELK